MFLVSVNGTLIGLTLSAMVSTAEKALTLFPLILIPELLLCGLFLPVKRIPMIIPLTVEELFKGQIYAQPEAKARAGEMMAEAAPQEPDLSVPELGGRLGHSVAGAIEPSDEARAAFHKYTPAPIEGMPTPIEWLSAVTVSRWGLEALSDLCLHGSHSTQDYAFKIINTISVTLHPNDLHKLEAGLEAPLDPQSGRVPFPLPSRFWPDKGPYLSILSSFLLLMTVLVLILMRRKDAT